MKETAKKIRAAGAKKDLISKAPVAHGVGRRKSSVARVWLRNGSGKITVNTKDFVAYFHTEVSRRLVLEPLAAVAAGGIYDVDINISGGGVHSQAGAARLGLARALVVHNEAHRVVLRENGYLTVDARVKERKKPGQKAARRKFQFVKR